MKRFIIYFSCIMSIILLAGCSMDNTPTKRVEKFLDNYTSNNETVLGQLKEMIDSDSLMTDDQKSVYSDIMKRQYKDMTYEIKDEVIDGNNATVTAEIEVYDYYKVNKESEEYYNNNPNEFKDNTTLVEDVKDATKAAADAARNAAEDVKDAVTGTTSDSKYVEYRLGKLKDAKDRVKYTIDFTLTKDGNEWKLNDIDDATRQKIHGLYEH